MVPRVWLEAKDRTKATIVPIHLDGKEVLARGVVGLNYREPQVSRLGNILSCGRWFRKDERQVVLLSDRLTRSLGISLKQPERATISFWGMDFQVVGCFRGEELETHVDLDGEPQSPTNLR